MCPIAGSGLKCALSFAPLLVSLGKRVNLDFLAFLFLVSTQDPLVHVHHSTQVTIF